MLDQRSSRSAEATGAQVLAVGAFIHVVRCRFKGFVVTSLSLCVMCVSRSLARSLALSLSLSGSCLLSLPSLAWLLRQRFAFSRCFHCCLCVFSCRDCRFIFLRAPAGILISVSPNCRARTAIQPQAQEALIMTIPSKRKGSRVHRFHDPGPRVLSSASCDPVRRHPEHA